MVSFQRFFSRNACKHSVNPFFSGVVLEARCGRCGGGFPEVFRFR